MTACKCSRFVEEIFPLREENERRVKQVLVELGDDLCLGAEKEVEGLQLPMRDAEIQRLCKQAQNAVLQRFVLHLSSSYLPKFLLNTLFFYHERPFSVQVAVPASVLSMI